MKGQQLLQHLAEPSDSGLRGVDARAKLLVMAGFVAGVSLTPIQSVGWPLLRLLALLVLLVVVSRVSWSSIWPRLLPLIPFLLSALFLPFFGHPLPNGHLSSPYSAIDASLALILRLCCLGGLMALIGASTSLDELLLALRSLGLSPRLCLLIGFIFRYLFLLLDEGLRMSRAFSARGGELTGLRHRQLGFGTVLGMLFLRAFSRGERILNAMQARGFHEQVGDSAPLMARSQLAGAVLLAVLAVVAGYPWSQHG